MKTTEIKSAVSIRNGELFLPIEDFAKILKSALDKKISISFKAKGFSMSPFIKNNDVITVAPLFKDTIRYADIVAYSNPKSGALIIHRVVDKVKNSYLIKGDNVSEADGLIPKENILGRVVKIERNGKSINFGLGHERILIAFLSHRKILGCILFLLRRIWRK